MNIFEHKFEHLLTKFFNDFSKKFLMSTCLKFFNEHRFIFVVNIAYLNFPRSDQKPRSKRVKKVALTKMLKGRNSRNSDSHETYIFWEHSKFDACVSRSYIFRLSHLKFGVFIDKVEWYYNFFVVFFCLIS